MIMLKLLKRVFLKPEGKEYRAPTFANRVMTVVTAHLFLSAIAGTLSMWGIFKGVKLAISMLCAFVLWAMGGKAELPTFAQDEVNKTVIKADDRIAQEKEEMIKRLQREKEDIQRKLARKEAEKPVVPYTAEPVPYTSEPRPYRKQPVPYTDEPKPYRKTETQDEKTIRKAIDVIFDGKGHMRS